MKEVNELLAQHGPVGVPFVSLRDVGTWYGGGTPSKAIAEFWDNGTVPWLSPKDMDVDTVQRTGLAVAESALERSPLKLVPASSVAFVMRSNVLRRRFPIALVPFETTLNQDMRAVVPRDGVLPEYLFHACRSRADEFLAAAGRTDGSMAAINTATLLDFRIPVPPLAVQAKIVSILAGFQKLGATLDEEIEARLNQRLALTRVLPDIPSIRALSPNGVERVRIGDVATQAVEPLRVQPDETYVNLGVRWYGGGPFARGPKPGRAIKGSTLYRVRAGQVIYNRMFVIEGSFGVIPPDLAGCVVSNEFPLYDLDHTRLLPGWLMLCFQNEYTLKRIAGEVTGVERGSTKSRRRWKEQQFEAFEIDLPSVAAQQEMLQVIEAGQGLEWALRDELVARRQQYEYYRDKLLTFEESA